MRVGNSITQKGQAMINAIVASGVVGLVSVVMLQQAQQTNKSLHLPRLKSAQSITESRVKTLLLNPTSFINCGENATSCTLRPDLFQGSEFSEFAVENPSFDANTRRFTANLRYAGDNPHFSVASQQISFDVPFEVMAAAQFICPDATPIFRRFGAGGVPVCEAFPSGFLTCGQNQYVVSINPNTLQVSCANFEGSLTCPVSDVLSQVQWNASGGSFSRQCQTRANVFEFHNFNPQNAVTQSSTVTGTGNNRVGVPADVVPGPNYTVYEGCYTTTTTALTTTTAATTTTDIGSTTTDIGSTTTSGSTTTVVGSTTTGSCIADGLMSGQPGAADRCLYANQNTEADNTCCSMVSHCLIGQPLTCGHGTPPPTTTTENHVVCFQGCNALQSGEMAPGSAAPYCSGPCNPLSFGMGYCDCPAGQGPCVAKEVSCEPQSACAMPMPVPPAACSAPPPPPTTTTACVAGVWGCASGECNPGPAPGCSYFQYISSEGEANRLGQPCSCRGVERYHFQRGSYNEAGVPVVCDTGFLSCE